MAKTLYLVRHAKSSWTDLSLDDFDRPLNKRGLHDAPEMGRRLKKRGIKPDIILCSPAKRTWQTVDLLLKEIGGSISNVQFEESIYEATVETLANLIQSLSDTCTSAMIIGHNPSMHELADWLSDTKIERMPTCAIATFEISSPRWQSLSADSGTLVDFDYPKKSH